MWLLAALSVPARAQPVETVELHHRSADELIPLLLPMAGPDASISAGSHVFLRAARPQADRLRALIAQLDQPARRLAVTLREDPPADGPQVHAGADGSVTVSTAREREPRGRESPADDDRSTTVATASRSRRLQVVEGEQVRIDLPATQSIRFRIPAGGGAGRPASASPGVPGATTASGGAAAVAGGVVTFESVTAFAARFAIAGRTVVIELTPLRQGAVAAYPEAPAAASVRGSLGEWIALGTAGPPSGPQDAGAASEPTSYAGVWVRVELDPAPASPR
ncbi:MAG TPA: hypothetical protein VF229_02685 [Burkholderiaceae bacterium]